MIGTRDVGHRVYEKIEPCATYKPWNKDAAFTDAYAAIRWHTLVDRFRCYELWTLVEQSMKTAGRSILEVGALRGGTGGLIALQAKRCGGASGPKGWQAGRPACTVYVCDTFHGIVKAGERDNQFADGDFAEWMSTPTQLEALYRHLGLENTCVLAGVFPDETAHLIPEGARFQFVHIDVDVYQSAKDVMEWVWPRLASGGIVVFDDYGFEECQGVTRYVEELMPLPDRVVLHNLNGHAIVVKR